MTVRIINADCLDALRAMPEASVHCVVTSPPYWGLRDYGYPGQLGLEKLHDCLGWATGHRCGECHVCHIVDVFREVWRVLRDDGTMWLNYGDSYASSGRGGNPTEETSTLEGGQETQKASMIKRCSQLPIGLKQKDLCGIPWRIAFALQSDGWFLRQDIVWHKPNPMPESCRDRCTKSHEYIFLLSKQQRYYCDMEAIAESAETEDNRRPYAPGQVDARGNGHDRGGGEPRKSKMPDGWDTGVGAHGKVHRNGREKGRKVELARGFRGGSYVNGTSGPRKETGNTCAPEGFKRNKRSVWTVATRPYSDAHFATFPPTLIDPCIKAGCPVGGVVLDPFGGAGTTGLVADRLGRSAVLIELNPEYAKMAHRRICSEAPLFAHDIILETGIAAP